MKLLITVLTATLLAPTFGGGVALRRLLTNDVQISESGIRLIITDDYTLRLPVIVNDQEVKAGRDLYWVLHNASTNDSGVLYLGLTNSLTIDLETTNGVPVQKTAMGCAMGKGPTSPTNPLASGAKRLGLGAGKILCSNLPQLTSLFDFPTNGVYVPEVRYWSWLQSKKRFALSEPVRVKVVREQKEEKRIAPDP